MITPENRIDNLRGAHPGMTAHIIGKGPSLDHLLPHHFPDPAEPIFCVNHSISVLERFSLPNPLYAVQNDVTGGERCWARLGTMLIPTLFDRKRLYAGHPRKYFYPYDQLSLTRSTLSAVVALKIARFAGCLAFRFVSFDAAVLGDPTEMGDWAYYPKCLGGGLPKFWRHYTTFGEPMERASRPNKFEWFIPERSGR